jgi:hypothetical protein
MKFIKIPFTITVFLFSIIVYAQDPLDPGWLWAESGGSSAAISGLTRWDYGMEHIVDIAVDGENNYYYLAEVGGYNFSLGEMEFETYNDQVQDKEIFIFSTDSEGIIRWNKIIGGGGNDRANSLMVDGEGNVYITGTTFNWTESSSSPTPVHFDTDSILSQGTSEPSAANKKIFIVKYDMDGVFQWLRQPEGDETPLGASGFTLRTAIESDGTTHSLIWLMQGSYFEGQLEVEEGDIQSVIIKYNSQGELEGFVVIDMQPLIGDEKYQMAYDANLDRYYIADNYRNSLDPDNPLGIGGFGVDTEDKGFYLAAVNNQGEVI